MAEPYIKLYKKMLDWEWYDNPNTCRVFIHCLLKANWKPCKWHGQEIDAGQFITSLATIADETSLTVDQVRTALNHLICTGEITSKSQSKFRIITVNNWDAYQADTKQKTKESPSKSQADPKQVPTDKEIKEVEEDKNTNTCITKNNKYAQFFETFWKAYPRHVDKARAYECYCARLNAGYSEEELLTACKNYAEECKKNNTEEKYIKHGSTFLSIHEPFRDYLKKGESADGYGIEQRLGESSSGNEERDKEIDEILRNADKFDGRLF